MNQVLIVEDDASLVLGLTAALEAEGHEVRVARTGPDGLRFALEGRPDLILLDLMLPGMSGFEICKRLRDQRVKCPVIMLTSRSEENDRVFGLELGADDYVTKPFSLRELSARVRAVLRRGAAPGERPMAAYRGARLSADFDAVAVAVDGSPVRLTRREFELLRYLVQNKNRVVSRDRLLERVWGYERLVETRSVDVHVGRLRGKLGSAGRQIETVVGLGYRFVE